MQCKTLLAQQQANQITPQFGLSTRPNTAMGRYQVKKNEETKTK